MTKSLSGSSLVVVFVLAFVLFVNTAAAQTTTGGANDGLRPNIGSVHEIIKSLLERIKTLQGDGASIREVVKTTQQEIRGFIKSDLRPGVTSDEVKSIQEVLASDPSIYPRGLVTGYFGPLTGEALKKFQEKFNLEATGEMNEETKEAMNALLEERFKSGVVPQGLLAAPGIQQKFVERLKEGCTDSLKAMGPFCLEMKKKHNWSDTSSASDAAVSESKSNTETVVGLKKYSTTPRGILVQKEIDSAVEYIEKLETAIEEADEDASGLDQAETALEDASAALDEAEDSLSIGKYVSAKRKAELAKRLARAGLAYLE